VERLGDYQTGSPVLAVKLDNLRPWHYRETLSTCPYPRCLVGEDGEILDGESRPWSATDRISADPKWVWAQRAGPP